MGEKLVICGLFCIMLAGCIIAARGPVGPPPHAVAYSEPRLVAIPEAGIQYAPDADVDLFFYGGIWYRWYGGYWYTATAYRGPTTHWTVIVEPPEVFYRIPRGHAKYHIVTARKARPAPPDRERGDREHGGERRTR